MPLDVNNFDSMMDFLKNKVVHTERGSFIGVDDLREAVKDFQESRKPSEEELSQSPIRTFAQAKRAARNDPDLAAAFPAEGPVTTDNRRRQD